MSAPLRSSAQAVIVCKDINVEQFTDYAEHTGIAKPAVDTWTVRRRCQTGLVEVPLSPGPFYLVVGWKALSRESLVAAFVQPKSSTPGEDVERALAAGCDSANVKLQQGDDFAAEVARFIDEFLKITGGGTNIEPPIWKGPTACNIIGNARTGGVFKGRVLYSSRFAKGDSITPGEDVEQALKAGSTWISIEVTKRGAALRPLR